MNYVFIFSFDPTIPVVDLLLVTADTLLVHISTWKFLTHLNSAPPRILCQLSVKLQICHVVNFNGLASSRVAVVQFSFGREAESTVFIHHPGLGVATAGLASPGCIYENRLLLTHS